MNAPGRWAAQTCALGLWVCTLTCAARDLKGIGRGHAGALPGAEYLLLRRFAILAHRGTRLGVLGNGKGMTMVAAGINPFIKTASGTGVASDGSLGNGHVSYSKGTYAIPASVGTQTGGNLFESFSQFNLLENEVADFQGPSSIGNIIARITGGTSSSIDGTIKSDIRGANLFLVNSAGFLFGPDASLNVTGAFTVSTADYVKLSGGGMFHSSLGAGDMLSAAAVDAFGFSGATPAPISFLGSGLSVPAGTGLNVIAGNVTLDSPTGNRKTEPADLEAPSGGLTIFCAASAGEVTFSLHAPGKGYASAKFSALGSLRMSNGSTVAINGLGGGSIWIRAGTISIDGAGISSENSGLPAGGDITVQAGGLISITSGGAIVADRDSSTQGGAAGNVTVTADTIFLDAGEIASSTLGMGNGGVVRVTAQNIGVFGAGGIMADSQVFNGGAAGEIIVTAASSLDLEGGGEINSSTLGLGYGGDVDVTAGQITISGATPAQVSSGIFAISDSPTQGGAAGNVVVNDAGTLEIAGGGEINSSTFGSGKGGAVMVTAEGILIAGIRPDQQVASGIYAESDSAMGGAAGSVRVTTAGLLVLVGGGTISSSTGGTGKGGDVNVAARGIAVIGGGILANSSSAGQGGAAGNVTVTAAGLLELEGGGEISSSTDDTAKGGTVRLTAGDITVADGLVSAESDSTGQGGAAGNVIVDAAGSLDVEDGGFISSTTMGLGAGGGVILTAREIDISGLGGIFANSLSPTHGGRAGDVTVNAATLELEGGGEISSSTIGLGHGGDVRVSAREITISGVADQEASGIFAISDSASAGGAAGDINVYASGLLKISGGGEISSSTADTGNGGNVTVTAGEIAISGAAGALNSGIAAVSNSPSEGGAAGNVVVNASGSIGISGRGEISSSTFGMGAGGTVRVTAEDIAISGPSGIFANSESSTRGGAAGDVMITAENLALDDGAQVATSALTSDAGDVTIDAGSDLTLEGGSTISSSAGISGGNISLNAGVLLYLIDSSITATAGALRDINGGSSALAGAGGNITLDSQFIVLSASLISANAAAGQGGNILLQGSYYLNSGSAITATGATSGTVTITTPELDLSGALVGLPATPIGAETQLQETCAMALNGDFSSFLAVGQGDIEAPPDEAQGGTVDGAREQGKQSGRRKPGRETGRGL